MNTNQVRKSVRRGSQICHQRILQFIQTASPKASRIIMAVETQARLENLRHWKTRSMKWPAVKNGLSRCEIDFSARRIAMSGAFIKSLLICFSTILVVTQAGAQKPKAEKFAYAVERSRDAARILPLLTAFPDDGIPKELIDRTSAIGVFPKVERETTYFTHMIHGYGVISVRRND